VNETPVGPAFPTWPQLNRRFRDVVAGLTAEQLAMVPAAGRWPLWATIGHAACQRVFWLCDFAGEPGADATPFPNAAWNCPGDDDLEHVLGPEALAAALDATFAIVERCLGTWTMEMLSEEISHPEWGPGRVHTRGFVLERVFMHDVSHATEVNETLGRHGLPQIDLWG
jgi:DinB superfamily